MLGWAQPAEWHLWTGSWGLLRPLQSYKSSGYTLMLLMLLPAWELGRTAVAVHLHLICGDKRKWPPQTPPSPHRHTPESLPVLSSTYCSQRYFVDVLYSCLPQLRPSSLSRLAKKRWGLKNDSREEQRTVLQEGRNREDVAWRDTRACVPTTLNPFWLRPRLCGEKNVKKGRTERRFSNQTISHFMCGSPSLPLSLSISLSPFSSL